MGIRTQHFCIYLPPQKTNCDFYFTCYCKICAKNKYDYQIKHRCYISYIPDIHIQEMYACTYATYEITGTNHSTRSTLHIFDTSLSKYGSPIPNIAHTANKLNGQIDPTCFAYIYILKPNPLLLIFHLLLCNMCPKQICHQSGDVCHIFDRHRWGTM